MKRCRNTWRPTVSSWDNYDRWQSNGSEDVTAAAAKKYKDILANSPDSTLDATVEKDLLAFVKRKRLI